MLALQRQREILKIIEQVGAVKVTDLAGRFDVTEETIRRDLTMLEKAGRVTRSHGGAVIAQSERHEVPHGQREITNKAEKIRIAEEALKRVEKGDTILLDASSSALFLAQLLPDIPCTVVTNSILTAQTLAEHRHVRVICTGGVFTPLSMSFLGLLAEKNLREYHVNKLFFSCRGVDLERGLSDSGDATAQIKQQMLKIADERILLVDNSKFNVRALSTISDIRAVTDVITDPATDKGICESIRKLGVQVTRTGNIEEDASTRIAT